MMQACVHMNSNPCNLNQILLFTGDFCTMMYVQEVQLLLLKYIVRSGNYNSQTI